MLKVVHINKPSDRIELLKERLLAKWEKRKLQKHLKQIKPKA